MCKLSLNQNLTKTLIYNPQDDYFYLNGVKTIYRGYQNAIAVFVNGQFGVEVDNGGTVPQSAYGASIAFNVSNNRLYYASSAVGTNKHCSILTKNRLDVTNYSTLKVKYMGSLYTLSVADRTGEYYIGVEVLYDKYIRLCITPVNSDWWNNASAKGSQAQVATITANSYIDEIILE